MTAEEIAAGLTEARKGLIRALPSDGSWGKAPRREIAKRVWWKFTPPLIHHKHCPTDLNEWCLTELGQQVRSILEGQQS